MGAFKGAKAQPLTIKRRPYHQAYWKAKKTAQKPLVTCPECGGSMFAGRAYCAKCAYANHRWDKCKCGELKTKEAKLCRSCQNSLELGRQRKLQQAQAHNPCCPNKFEGAGSCETLRPHAHCLLCGWPVKPDIGYCPLCMAEIERGVDMDGLPDEEAS